MQDYYHTPNGIHSYCNHRVSENRCIDCDKIIKHPKYHQFHEDSLNYVVKGKEVTKIVVTSTCQPEIGLTCKAVKTEEYTLTSNKITGVK